MSLKNIPEHIDPFRFAEQKLSIQGVVSLDDMPRLSSHLRKSDERVKVNLKFDVDEQEITYLIGHLETKLTLQCQRCLMPFIYEINTDFILGITRTLDEANALPSRYEPVLTKENSLGLKEVIEDEIILNLPIIPKHESKDCKVKLPIVDKDWKEEEKDRPFQILESIKFKKDN